MRTSLIDSSETWDGDDLHHSRTTVQRALRYLARGGDLSAAMRLTAVLFVLLVACATAAGPATPSDPAPPIPPKPAGVPGGKQWKDVLDKTKEPIAKANKAFAKSAETAKRVLDKLKNPFAKMGSKAYGNKNSGQTNNDAKGSENTPPPAGQASAGGSWWKKGGWFNKKGGMFSDLKKKVAEQADKFKNARGDGALVIPLSPWSC